MYLRHHVTLIRPPKWRQLVAVHALARILADLALATGEAEDREEAITALERARSLSWDAEVDAACLASLARLRLQRFSDLHEPADLESAINEGFEVAIGEDASAFVRQLAVATVAQGLRIRAEATGSKDDLTVAIYQAETLLAEMGTSYAPFQLEVRDLVAVLLRRRFSYTADLADLDRAISMRRQLLEESADDRERALHLDNLETSTTTGTARCTSGVTWRRRWTPRVTPCGCWKRTRPNEASCWPTSGSASPRSSGRAASAVTLTRPCVVSAKGSPCRTSSQTSACVCTPDWGGICSPGPRS